MLDVFAGRFATCDGTSRRSFLRVGALGALGIALPDVLRARAAEVHRGKDTAVIQVFLGGGPSHIDTYDLKPNAPREFRGEFRPIATAVRGYGTLRAVPAAGRVMDKLAIVRSIAPHHVGPQRRDALGA